MKPEFEVKSILELKDRVYIIAEQINNVEFEVSETSTVGNIRIEPWLEQPREIVKGEQKENIFAFVLKNSQDKIELHKGKRIYLSP